ncbi:Ig-like domain-containing protein [Jatrophihabitans endophyticus]|uniref:L,D-transpeptidase n=1 Tax=Jatrophihabitans endophyticus TaxID=1206085 RepID=UPI0019FE0BDE|nr:Ig-like domain-containing protein [Jatrophihabitans endophyticus]MBE7186833.1 L,D-transpeptidase family protein [Jatrophihabitans endophyticus]
MAVRNTPVRTTVVGIVAVATAVGLTACTAQSSDTHPGAGKGTSSTGAGPSVSTPSSSPRPSLAAEITSLPAAGAKRVNPGKPFMIKVAHGTLSQVVMTNAAGTHVRGSMNAARTSWTTAEALGYGKTYTVRSSARNADGKVTRSSEKISTLDPADQTTPTIVRIGNYPLTQNKKYGVAVVPVVHFDEPVHNFKAAEKAMTVTTSPTTVKGAWYWADNQDAHFRPQHWWPSGTTVTIHANLYGVKLAHGLFGSTDVSRTFRIGRKQVTVADDNAPKVDKVRVYNAAGKLLRTMNTSMGEHSGETVNGQYINFYTLDGTYTVLDHENPANMCSASYGLPANAPGGYGCEPIYWSTKISIDGIYLHELDTTEWAQNSGYDVSHGCLNMTGTNAKWYFNHSMDGDPVVIHGTKGAPTLQVWEGGDWTVPWKKWVKGGVAA